ncbi:MAG: hypothetical protein LAO21_09175 [Acidobacteriia bacterium]|nr:hypothetical protein [Terriglobia bacterium]
MACPFFFPLEPMDHRRWPGRPESPLGDGFVGECRAESAAALTPEDSIQKEFCNFGYPGGCPHFPERHPYQAVRFAMIHDKNGRMVASYILEDNHRPYMHGELVFNVTTRQIENPHSDSIIHRQSTCYFESFLRKKPAVRPSPGS